MCMHQIESIPPPPLPLCVLHFAFYLCGDIKDLGGPEEAVNP